jgi:hypothetical protein
MEEDSPMTISPQKYQFEQGSMHENAATGTKKAREETTVLDYRLIIKRTC